MARLRSRKRTTGRPWMRLRAAVLDAQPLCVRCLAAGRTVAAEVLADSDRCLISLNLMP